MEERIPLTDEILDRNGFTDHPSFENHHFYLGSEYFIENEDLHIGRTNPGVYSLRYRHNSIWGIKYVDELQMFFDFFGIGIVLQ